MAEHLLVLMQVSTHFGMNVALSLATISNVHAITRSLLCTSFASLCALSRKPLKARLKKYKHMAEKERISKRRTLDCVSIQLLYDRELCALRLR